MLTQLCEYLKNWEFNEDNPEKHIGQVTIADGTIAVDDFLLDIPVGQYIRVVGSIFSDGVHLYPDQTMADEVFDGAIWLLKIPPEVINLADEITAWRAKYERLDAPVMSPYTSESFAGYSYSKAGAGGNANGVTGGWQQAFANQLEHWRKI